MIRSGILVFFCCFRGSVAQQAVVTKSRSNVKNNITVNRKPDGALTCLADNQPCTKDHVNALSEAAVNAKGSIASLSRGLDGSLVCKTIQGNKCGEAQVRELNRTAAEMRPGDPIKSVGVGLLKKSQPK